MRILTRAALPALTLALAVVGNAGAASDRSNGSLTISSPKFANGGEIPKLYTCAGRDRSPPLTFSNVPSGAKTLALIVEDPDANEPPQRGFTHWVVFDIPADAKGLPEGARGAVFPSGTREGVNDARAHGYVAPCPPRGISHHYLFKLYALDDRIDRQGLTKIELEDAMNGHVLAEAELVGLYQK